MVLGLFTLRYFQFIMISNSCCSITLESHLQDGCAVLSSAKVCICHTKGWLTLTGTGNNKVDILLQNSFNIISAYFLKIIGICSFWWVYFLNTLVDVSKRRLHSYLWDKNIIRQNGLTSWMKSIGNCFLQLKYWRNCISN